MKYIFYIAFWVSMAVVLQADAYWLIEEDFIKLGKKELYETEKRHFLKKQSEKVVGLSDLDNPQYVFLMPLKKIGSLENYPPFVSVEKDPILETTLHFQIFSLHKLIEQASVKPLEVFIETRPYVFYAVYDVEIESTEIFEEHFKAQAKSMQKERWCFWRGILAGTYPKYIFCISFETKAELVNWSMDKILNGLDTTHILRSRVEGKLKQNKELSFD
jgi:hypothetical protein